MINILCVLCQQPGQDAHHIMDRKLFPDGGYYLDNGVTVWPACHLLAEKGRVTPDWLRNVANIKTVILPPDFEPEFIYDKWDNPIQIRETYD